MKTWLKILIIPLSILIVSITYIVLWRVFNLPRGEAFVALATEFFNKYGLWMVLVCSIIESALLLGNYFPGGVVIFLSVIAAGGNPGKVALTVLIVCIGFFIGYTIDFLLGKYGWYKALVHFGMQESIEQAKQKLSRHSFKAFLGSYWEPNIASITATSAGILQIPLKRFVLESVIALVLWNAVWGILVALLGERAMIIFSKWEYLLIAVVIWGSVIAIKHWRAHKVTLPL